MIYLESITEKIDVQKVGKTTECVKWEKIQVLEVSDGLSQAPLGDELCLSCQKTLLPFPWGVRAHLSNLGLFVRILAHKRCPSASWSTNILRWNWPPANNKMKAEYSALTNGSWPLQSVATGSWAGLMSDEKYGKEADWPSYTQGWKTHLCCAALSRSVMSDPLWPHGPQPTRLLCPWGFSRQEHWSGLPCHPPGDFPDLGIEPRSPASQVDS